MITAAEYKERLAAMCHGRVGSAFPRRSRDRHILYRSIVQMLDVTRTYSEAMLNAALQRWLSEVGNGIDIDRVTLRRYLIDEAYLSRDPDGSAYRVNLRGRDCVEFDQAIAAIDPAAVIQEARLRTAARKRERSEHQSEADQPRSEQ